MKTDVGLRQDVERELVWDPKIDASNITVTATNGVVTLTGRVRSYLDKWEVANLVKRIVGVAGIADEVLDGTTPNDTDLTERVLHTLEANVLASSETIKHIVHDGLVTLEGAAPLLFITRSNVWKMLRAHYVACKDDRLYHDRQSSRTRDVSKKIAYAFTRNARVDAR
jgi:osmotically-inducible protein OsmY